MRQPSLDDLTPRERQVLHWLAEGKSSYETGVILRCSEATVKKHRCRIYRTLRVPNAISAAIFYGEGVRTSNAPELSRVDSPSFAWSLSKVAGPSMGY